MTQALKLISPNLVASLRTLELVFAYGVQTIITGDIPDIWSCFGGGLVMIGVLILAFQDKIYEILRTIRPHVNISPTTPTQYRQQGMEEYSRLYG